MQRWVEVREESWPLRAPFQITGKTWLELSAVVVELGEGEFVGRGEAAGVYYLDESADSMIAQIRSVNAELTAGMTRVELLDALPPGGARNAIDCALWDLEAKIRGSSVWDIAGIRYAPVQTVMTIPIRESAEEMGQEAQRLGAYPLLKVKLDSRQPVERLTAIRKARPDATIVVDANQGFTFELLKDVLPAMARLNIAMIEQPLPRGEDDCLEGFASPVPLCADESCLHAGELADVAARYRMINIKLDKCGGLTAALCLANQGRRWICH